MIHDVSSSNKHGTFDIVHEAGHCAISSSTALGAPTTGCDWMRGDEVTAFGEEFLDFLGDHRVTFLDLGDFLDFLFISWIFVQFLGYTPEE